MDKNWHKQLFKRERVESPVLNYYFKSVTVDWILHAVIKHAKIKAGLQRW